MKREIKRDWKPDLMWLLGIAVMALVVLAPQLTYHALAVGDDWEFHWNRFYEAAMQIKTGKFNFFQSLYSFRQSGRIVNAVYGSVFAYLHGLILVFVKTWFRAEIISSFLCLFTAGSGMYYLTRYCQVKRQLAFGAAVLYMGTPLVIFYVTDSALRGWGAALLPLTTIPLIRMVVNHRKPINPVLFGLSAAVLMAVQNFTALLYVLSAVVFFIPGLYLAKNRWRTILDAFGAVAIAIGLNAATLAAILDLRSEHLVMPYRVADLLGSASRLSLGNMTRLDFGLIFSVIIVFQLVFACLSWKQLTTVERLINLDGLFFLWLSSAFFPWNFLAEHFQILQTVQFPQRFNVVAFTMVILGATLSIQKFEPKADFQKSKLITSVFLGVAGLNLVNGYTWVNEKAVAWKGDQVAVAGETTVRTQAEIREIFDHAYDESHVFSAVTKNTSDYLPVPKNVQDTSYSYNSYKKQILHNPLNVKKTVNKENQLVLSWQSKRQKQTLVPVIVYKHSTVRLNGQRLDPSQYKRSDIGTLIIPAREGKNTVTVGYEPSKLFWVAAIINVLTVGYLLVYGGFKLKGHCTRK
ncbi:hypothetical protein [Lacticaseibacillus casei]